MSSEAYELLDCFAGEMSNLVYAIAESFARSRHSVGPGQGASTLIEAQDIRSAVGAIARGVEKLIESGEVPTETAAELEEMLECFRSNSGETQ